ncbi:hypothetical protein N8I77_011978 [Diaporthe amygdali]|uniref:Protein kinase domain-containing protein n=1 Tax=Phomopsis amygdali TaxID=1214568 RepID=A0AAD9S3S6_PHOAM|nr:hypothetical protein N8I77_011978 [Diaporthe amygdali]
MLRRPSPPVGRGRLTPSLQRGTVTLPSSSKYRVEKPQHLAPTWMRDRNGRLVSYRPTRPNIGGSGDLEAFYHVQRTGPDEILPPPQTLWRQRYGDECMVNYRPLWVGIAQNLVQPLRKRSDVSSDAGDLEGDVGVPYLFAYDETVTPDENGEQYARWVPLKILANGGYGVVIMYVDDNLSVDEDTEIAPDDIIVAKFNYKDGDLVDIMASVVGQIRASQMIRQAQLEDAQGSLGSSRTRSSTDSSLEYSHFQQTTEELDVDTKHLFRQENMILELLDMTGSPHFPKFWRLADPPQDGTLCTMGYIPGGVTLDEHLDTRSNDKIPIRLVWEAVFCLSKAMSAMAYGSEDPAPSHRVHGWNQIVHLDWSAANIFVRRSSLSHTCSHGPCFMVGDFGFAVVVPNKRNARIAFRNEHLKLGWHKNLNSELPEANIDIEQPFKFREHAPIIGHFSHKTNVFLMAGVWKDNLGGNQIGRIGFMRYMQDGLTVAEQTRLAFYLGLDLEAQVPEDEQLGKPLNRNEDEDEDDASDGAQRLRGYVDLAESLLKQQVVQNLRVSEQRFANLMTRCRSEDPSQRPEIEEIMLQAARGMAEAGEYVPPSPSSGSE